MIAGMWWRQATWANTKFDQSPALAVWGQGFEFPQLHLRNPYSIRLSALPSTRLQNQCHRDVSPNNALEAVWFKSVLRRREPRTAHVLMLDESREGRRAKSPGCSLMVAAGGRYYPPSETDEGAYVSSSRPPSGQALGYGWLTGITEWSR